MNRDEKCTICGLPRHAHWGAHPLAAGRCSGFEGHKPVTVRILWGQAPDDEDKPVEYTFSSQELLDAFMQGVEAAVGWLEMRVVEEETT